MKKKLLSLLTAVCVFIVFPNAAICQCVGADCSFVAKEIQASVPQCHPAAAQAKEGRSSREECCGKCRIEKAAILSSDFLISGDIRAKSASAEDVSFVDFHPKVQSPPFFRSEYAESPPGFFERYVLNTTFSFRAPPQGCAL